MQQYAKITAEDEAAIIAELTDRPHASFVAGKTGFSFSTLWRIADGNDIPLTAGRETMGRHRLTAEQRAAVIAAGNANPEATQEEIARATGVSRPSVSKIEGGLRGRGQRGLRAG
jgi:hypothetical protein